MGTIRFMSRWQKKRKTCKNTFFKKSMENAVRKKGGRAASIHNKIYVEMAKKREKLAKILFLKKVWKIQFGKKVAELLLFTIRFMSRWQKKRKNLQKYFF